LQFQLMDEGSRKLVASRSSLSQFAPMDGEGNALKTAGE